MAMGIVDTLMVGRLPDSAVAIGRCNRALWAALWICVPLARWLAGTAWLVAGQIPPDVRAAGAATVQVLKWGAPPLLRFDQRECGERWR